MLKRHDHHAKYTFLIFQISFGSNGDCDDIAAESSKREELDWKRRYDIICGVARGLLYLHEDSHNCIIHRDIKASNILLDDKWIPKIADFGMARLFPEDQTHVNTRVAGTKYVCLVPVHIDQYAIACHDVCSCATNIANKSYYVILFFY